MWQPEIFTSSLLIVCVLALFFHFTNKCYNIESIKALQSSTLEIQTVHKFSKFDLEININKFILCELKILTIELLNLM